MANIASWLSLSLARSKKRPFVHSAALGRERAARRRATIRSTAVAAASRSSIRAVHRASGCAVNMVEGERVALQLKLK